jgi:hypothetical protein
MRTTYESKEVTVRDARDGDRGFDKNTRDQVVVKAKDGSKFADGSTEKTISKSDLTEAT